MKIQPFLNFAAAKAQAEVHQPLFKINVRFADEEPLHFQIKHSMKTHLQSIPFHSALFQIASRLETHAFLPISKSLPPEFENSCSLPGLDYEKPNFFERSKNVLKRAVYSSKITG